MDINHHSEIISALPDAIVLFDPTGEILDVNQSATNLLQRSRDELIGSPLPALLNDRSQLSKRIHKWSTAKDRSPDMLNFIIDDAVTPLNCQGSAVDRGNGHAPELFLLKIALNDNNSNEALNARIAELEEEVLEHRRIQNELTRSEKQVRMLLDSTGDAIFGVNTQQQCTFANKACLKKLGYQSVEELNEQGILNLLEPENEYPEGLEAYQQLKQAHQKNHPYKSDNGVFRTQSGKHIQVEFILHPIIQNNTHQGSVITFQDVTTRKTTENQLIRSQNSLEQAQSIANIGSWEWDLQHEEIYWTDEVYRILDLEPQLFRPDYNAFLAFVPREERVKIDKAIQDFKAQLKGELNIEHRVLKSDGEAKIVNLRAKLFNDEQGNPIKIIGSIQDITEKKLAEEEIRSLNAELEQRVEQRTSELHTSNIALQYSIDQLQQTQDQLVESEKMAALGGLVAGVAHEINTPVGVSVTAASHLSTKLRAYKEKYLTDELTCYDFERLIDSSSKACDLILNNLERAANLISSFKKIAVDQTSDAPRKLNMRQYLDEIVSSLTPKLKRLNPDIHIECDESLNFYTHPGAISQVLTNLLMNSIVHGFEEPIGRKETIHINVKNDDKSVTVQYLDNGKGLNEEQKAKIFNPFFTTKRDNGGSGLGMHIVYNLVSQTLQGKITLNREQREGVGFTITFPLHTEQSSENAQ